MTKNLKQTSPHGGQEVSISRRHKKNSVVYIHVIVTFFKPENKISRPDCLPTHSSGELVKVAGKFRDLSHC